MRAYYFIKLVFHTFMTSQILLNTPAASYFSILKWQHNEALCTPTPLSSKYYSYCVPSRCADMSKEVWPFFWLLEGVYKWLSKKFPQAGIHQWGMDTSIFFKYLVNNIFNITVGTYHHHCPELPLFLKKPFSYTPNTLAAAIVLLFLTIALFSSV